MTDLERTTQTLDAVRQALGRKWQHNLLIANDIAVIVRTLEWYASRADDSSLRAKMALALIRQQTESTVCEVCNRQIVVLVSESDDVPATFCRECGGGRISVMREEILP
jgi:hypothetical protein